MAQQTSPDYWNQFEEDKRSYWDQFEAEEAPKPKPTPAPQSPGIMDRVSGAIEAGSKFIDETPMLRRFFKGPTNEEMGLPEDTKVLGKPNMVELPGIVQTGLNKLDEAAMRTGYKPLAWGTGFLRGAMAPTVEIGLDPSNVAGTSALRSVPKGPLVSRMPPRTTRRALPPAGQGTRTFYGGPEGISEDILQGIPPETIDVKPSKIEEVFTPGKPEVNVPNVKVANPTVNRSAQDYINAVKSGKVPRDMTFEQFKKTGPQLSADDTDTPIVFSPDPDPRLGEPPSDYHFLTTMGKIDTPTPEAAQNYEMQMMGHFIDRFGPDWVSNFKKKFIDRLDDPNSYFGADASRLSIAGYEDFKREAIKRLGNPPNNDENLIRDLYHQFTTSMQTDAMMRRELETLTPIPTRDGRNFHFYDPGKRATQQELDYFVHSPVTQLMGGDISDIVKGIDTALGSSSINKIKSGIVLHNKIRGNTLFDNSVLPQQAGIFVNPYQIMSHNTPDGAAAGIMHTLLHEYSHLNVLGHNEGFTVNLSNIYEKYGAKAQIEAQERILNAISAGTDRSQYSPEVLDLLQRYQGIAGRRAATQNSLDRSFTRFPSNARGTGEISQLSKSSGSPIARTGPEQGGPGQRGSYIYNSIKTGIERGITPDKLQQQFAQFLSPADFNQIVADIKFEKASEAFGPNLMSRAGKPFEERSNFIKTIGTKGVDDKTTKWIYSQIAAQLKKGGQLDLEKVYSASEGLTRKKFDKIVDNIINSGALEQDIRQAQAAMVDSPIQKLMDAIEISRPMREAQEAIYSAERSARFKAFEGVKTTGQQGFRERMGKLAGEMQKVHASPLQLEARDVDTLYDQITSNRYITPGEKARAGIALGKILEGGAVPQRGELALLDKVFGNGFGEKIIEMHGGLGLAGLRLTKTANTMKSMMAALDLSSAVLRQGIGLIHRKEWRSAFKEMFKVAFNEQRFQELNKALENRPYYLIGRENGLFLAGEELAAREEQFLNSYLGDLMGLGNILKEGGGPTGKAIGKGIGALTAPFRASERAYVGFLNKLRADVFDNLLEKAAMAGHDPDIIAKDIARHVNTQTGRGDLGKAGKYADALNTAFFSPRLIASRLTVLNPMYYVNAPKFIRKEALKSLFAMAGFIGVANGIGAALGGKLTFDPRNSDFGKVKFGNTRVDPGAGYSQYIVAASRFLTGQSISPTSGNTRNLGEGYGTPSRMSLLFGIGGREKSFMENKFSPLFSLIDALGTGTDYSGQPLKIAPAIKERFTPIIYQDITELMQSNPELFPLIPLANFGMGVQTFEPRQPSMGMGEMTAPSIGQSLRP